MKKPLFSCLLTLIILMSGVGWGAVEKKTSKSARNNHYLFYPKDRPPREAPPAGEGNYSIFPDRKKQVIKGIGFEIQSDSIASGNEGLPEATTSVPHDLLPSERERFYQQMLKGFRYCRLAGGLYLRGTDENQKYLQGRWPEQLDELKEMIQKAGIEGVSFEYWSPPPYWKANRSYTAKLKNDPENKLRCFGKDFTNDPEYKGDVDRFLKDFTEACCRDLKMLRDAGIPIAMWGLQNEPHSNNVYSTCIYSPEEYCRTFLTVAPAVRALDPDIFIYTDSQSLSFIKPALKNPENLKWIDGYAIHTIGFNSNTVKPLDPSLPKKPFFQNEYEYEGLASPARCLNTVQSIMNWFQIAEAPTWFWIHALKPIKNAEASGYSLGFWRPINDTSLQDDRRFPGLKPGEWTWNKYNWHAVGSFVRHLPWDSQCVEVREEKSDEDLRILAFTRPNGKLTIVLSNRSYKDHTFKIDTGMTDGSFKGYRYTPDESGENFLGKELEAVSGQIISPHVPDMAWEFWEQQ